ncbi:MAG: hypothetical protein VX278_01575, partial [Myxococcota bacterium]|nr:hypothetical protein [Myxococcota bacterium]
MISLLIHFSHAQPWAFFDEQSVLIEDTIVRASNRVILPCEAPFDSTPLSGNWCILQTQTAEEAIHFAQTYHAAFDTWPDLWLPKNTHTFNDPLFDGQWYLDYLQIEELFEQSMGNSSIKIAVIDSGIDIY